MRTNIFTDQITVMCHIMIMTLKSFILCSNSSLHLDINNRNLRQALYI